MAHIAMLCLRHKSRLLCIGSTNENKFSGVADPANPREGKGAKREGDGQMQKRSVPEENCQGDHSLTSLNEGRVQGGGRDSESSPSLACLC